MMNNNTKQLKVAHETVFFSNTSAPSQKFFSVQEDTHRGMLSLSEYERQRSMNLETQFARTVGEDKRQRSLIRAPRDGR